MVKAVSYTEDGLPSRLFNGMYRSSILADENDFTIDENGALTSYTGDLNDIIIPSHINGVEVTDIYKSTFDGPDMSVWGVTLPDTIKVLGAKPENARRRNSFMDNECILFIDGESVEELGAQVFMGCESLAFVNLPNVKKAGTSAFSRISTITKLYMPKLEIVGDSCFESSSFYQLILPELTTCSEYSFNMLRAVRMECPKLKSVEPFRWKIGECAFADAQVLHPLDLPEIEDFNERDSFAVGPFYLRKIIARLEFSKLKSMDDLPGNWSTLVLPSTVERLPKDLSDYWTDSYTVYGSVGTYAENWAKSNKIKFIEITPETAVITDLPKYYKPYMGELEADVVGFNRAYQWYANEINSNEGGTAIEGATSKTFNPTDYTAKYYYCVVTSTDEGYDPIVIKTSACENRSVSADYSKVDAALEKVPENLNIYTSESRTELENAINSVRRNLDISKQAEVDNMALALENAISGLKKIADYSKVDAALEKVPENLNIYTSESRTELENAINSVRRNLDVSRQAEVDNMALALENAILGLKKVEVNLSHDNIVLNKNESFNVTAESETAVSWSTSNPDVATVDEKGKVTAVGRGTATITATDENGISDSCTVTVKLTLWQWMVHILWCVAKLLVNCILTCFTSL